MSWVESAECSPDGRRVVTASGDNKVRVWNADTGQMIFAADGPPKLLGQTPLLANAIFSPDGHQLASGSLDKTVRIWRVPQGKPSGPPDTGPKAKAKAKAKGGA